MENLRLKHLSLPSQLVIRQHERLTQQPLLVVNAPDPEVADILPVVAHWQWHAGYAERWQHQQHEVAHHFDVTPPATTTAEAALIWLPKEKQLTLYLLDALCHLLPPGAPIWLVGENRSGIKSVHKQFTEVVAPSQKVAVGCHSLLICTQVAKSIENFDYQSYFESCELPQPGQDTPLQLASLPGVFAFPGIDAGSAMLLQHLPHWQQGHVLDFACGHGVLGAWLNRQAPALQVTYLDVSAIALAATQRTLALNQLQGDCIASEGLQTSLGKFDYVVSHPPFHTGLATDYVIGQQFLRQVTQHLRKNGELWLVANRFLPWPELIEQAFGHCERIAEDNKFAVYRAQQRN